MASAEKLPSKRWRGLYRDSAGAKQRVPDTFARKSDALEAAQELEVEARRKAAAATGKLSARTTWGNWWRIFSADRSFDSDTELVQGRVVKSFVMKRWGDVPLNAIKREDIQTWIDELARKHSANYTRNIYAALQVSVNAAMDQGVLNASPCVRVKLPRRPKRAKVYVSTDEAPLLRKNINEKYADAIDFMLEVGIRPGELAGLHVHRADLERGWLTVADAYVRRLKKMRPHPKDGDVRVVPLSSRAIEIIRRQIKGRDLAKGCGVEHTDGSECTNELIFRNVRGGVMHQDLLSMNMRIAAKAAEIPSKNGYALRRGFATRAIEGGMDTFSVKRIMGHADLEELEGYVQETPAARARMLASLGERPPLSSVKKRGTRGTGRGTEVDNQSLPTATGENQTNAG